jgi:hypothetical protein
MKKNLSLRYSLLGLTALTLLFSCKKDKADDAPKLASERILGTWNLVKEYEKSYAYNTGAFKDSTGDVLPMGKLTLEFRSDGKIYQKEQGSNRIYYDTLSYQLKSEPLIVIDGDNYTIQQLTDTEMKTLDKYDDGRSNIDHFLEFKK